MTKKEKKISNNIIYKFKIFDAALPWWLSGKRMPANSEDIGSVPCPGKIPQAAEQLRRRTATTKPELQNLELQLRTLHAANTEARVP